MKQPSFDLAVCGMRIELLRLFFLSVQSSVDVDEYFIQVSKAREDPRAVASILWGPKTGQGHRY